MAQPFGEPLDDRSREIYGKYRSRYSRLKVGLDAGGSQTTSGIDGRIWRLMPITLNALYPEIHDIALYQLHFNLGAGFQPPPHYPMYKILIDGIKVYPFDDHEEIIDDTTYYLGTLSTTVKTGQRCEVWIRSTSEWDKDLTIMVAVKYAELREV